MRSRGHCFDVVHVVLLPNLGRTKAVSLVRQQSKQSMPPWLRMLGRKLKYLNKIDTDRCILIHSSERLVDCKFALTVDAAVYLRQSDFASSIPVRAAVCQENVHENVLAVHQAFTPQESTLATYFEPLTAMMASS